MIEATLFLRPNGGKITQVITDISPYDANWFKANDVKISMEDIGISGFACYADYGRTLADGEPVEMIVISGGRTCKAVMGELRVKCEVALDEWKMEMAEKQKLVENGTEIKEMKND